MSGYWPYGYWMNGVWYSWNPWPTPAYYTYTPQIAFIVGPCSKCNRNFALVNPSQGQPVPKFCGECASQGAS